MEKKFSVVSSRILKTIIRKINHEESREADIEIKADDLFFFISLRQNAKSVSLN